MPTPLVTADGRILDAHFDVENDTLVFHSRGGSKGRSARNTDYGEGLRLILRRINDAALPLEMVVVDSSLVRSLPIHERFVLGPSELSASPEMAFTLISNRMKSVAAASQPGRKGGNSTRRLRFHFAGASPLLIRHAIERPARAQALKAERLPVAELDKVTAEHVWRAVAQLRSGVKPPLFGPSTFYDLVTEDGLRLPPKQVFALAAAEALQQPIIPDHFSGGLGTPCFRILEQAGYVIVAKGASLPDPPPPSSEDREWLEGGKALVSHLRSERAAGLGEAKKASFKAQHGRLFCEDCGLDPVARYKDPLAVSCIEAHHAATRVEEMLEGHTTRLEDLRCLCANCHRLEHRRLREQARREASVPSVE